MFQGLLEESFAGFLICRGKDRAKTIFQRHVETDLSNAAWEQCQALVLSFLSTIPVSYTVVHFRFGYGVGHDMWLYFPSHFELSESGVATLVVLF